MAATVKAVVVERPWDVTIVAREVTVTPVDRPFDVKVSGEVVRVAYVVRQGPAGAPGNAEAYVHDQPAPAAVWTVNHNLGRKPNVELRSTGGVVIAGAIVHTSNNQLVVSFATALAGSARLI